MDTLSLILWGQSMFNSGGAGIAAATGAVFLGGLMDATGTTDHRVTRVHPLPHAAVTAWGIWFLASFVIFTIYLERPQFVDLRWSVTYWLLVLVTPYARYKYRDPDVVISLASIVLLMAAENADAPVFGFRSG